VSARHLVLVGMMGAGKTTVGRRIAARLDRPFLDSDAAIEARTGRTVAQIFADEGEPAFRRFEAEVLREMLVSDEPAVIAAAGGTVLDGENRRALRGAALVVWLRAAPDVLATRVRAGDHRPLLDDDALGTLQVLAREREPLYREVADVIIDAESTDPEHIAERVAALVEDDR
jgi:shikimate kinase